VEIAHKLIEKEKIENNKEKVRNLFNHLDMEQNIGKTAL